MIICQDFGKFLDFLAWLRHDGVAQLLSEQEDGMDEE